MNTTTRALWQTPPALMLVILLSACGGGSGGGGNTLGGGVVGGDTTPPPAPSGRYLFYQSGIDGPLMAIDPDTPQTPIQVSTGNIRSSAIAPMGHGFLDASTATISDMHTRTIIYAEHNKLWRVGAFKADALAITQVSGETGADTICQNVTATNLTDHNNAAYVYELPGADNNCATTSDNPWHMVRVGMSSTTAPITNARKPLTSIDNSTTGEQIGWLVNDTGTLKRYSADFSSSQSVVDAPSGYTSIWYYGPINISMEIIRIDGGIGVYTIENNTWSKRADVISNFADAHFLRRNGQLYFADLVTDTTTVPPTPYLFIFSDRIGIPSATTTELSRIINFETTNYELALKLTTNKVIAAIHQKTTPTETTLININSSLPATTPTVLTNAAIPGKLRSLITNGDKLYYSFYNSLTDLFLTDGTDETLATTPNLSSTVFDPTTSAWLGAIQSNQQVIGNTPEPALLFLSEGYTNSISGFANGTLTRYNAATAARETTIGTIPANIKEIHIEGNRAITLASGIRNDDGSSEVFFVNVDGANSLKRVTNDNIDDIIIDAYH